MNRAEEMSRFISRSKVLEPLRTDGEGREGEEKRGKWEVRAKK